MHVDKQGELTLMYQIGVSERDATDGWIEMDE